MELIKDPTRSEKEELAHEETALRHRAVVDHFRRGAARASARYPEPGVWPDQETRFWVYTTRLAILNARSLTRQGKTKDSVELLLALCQYGRDLLDGGPWSFESMGTNILELAFAELSVLLTSTPALPAASTREIETRLSALNESVPRRDRAALDRIRWLGEQWVDGALDAQREHSLSSWRFGFSHRLRVAEQFDHWDRWIRRSLEADPLPWPAAQSLIARIRSEVALSRFAEATCVDDGSPRRTWQTHLRMLLIAARYRRTGEVLILEDPFGGTFLHEDANGRLKLWSLGRDGADQNGTGDWDARPVNDIVLEVPR